jgi:hemolysin III
MDDPPIIPFVLRDPVSSLTHLCAAALAVYVTLLLRRLTRDDPAKRRSLTVFGVSMVVLYAASGTYHAVNLPQPSAVIEFFRRLDHSAIYALIAGTFTPVLVVVLADTWARRLLPWAWVLAAAGIAAKWLLPFTPHPLTVGLYLALGWLGVLPVGLLWQRLGRGGVFWAVLGGVLYTAGAACELTGWPYPLPGYFGPHEILHMCDMAGTAAHTVVMFRYVVPYPTADRLDARPTTQDSFRSAGGWVSANRENEMNETNEFTTFKKN